MAHPTYKDAAGSTRSRKSTNAAGTNGDPDVFIDRIESMSAGASPDIGSTTDAKVITDSNGSMISFLRGIVYLLANRLAAVGQALMAASMPVVIASDQTAIPVSGTVLNGGPSWTQNLTPTSSADMSAAPDDLTPAPDSGAHMVIESVTVSVDTAMILTLQEETTGATIKVFNLTAGNLNAEWNPANGARLPNQDKKLQGLASVSGQVDITVISHSAA
jgi:hypothetical protein